MSGYGPPSQDPDVQAMEDAADRKFGLGRYGDYDLWLSALQRWVPGVSEPHCVVRARLDKRERAAAARWQARLAATLPRTMHILEWWRSASWRWTVVDGAPVAFVRLDPQPPAPAIGGVS